jgi:hypothetical protein
MRLMRSPCSLSLCPSLITFERTAIFSRNSVGGHAIEGDLDAIYFNPVASGITKLAPVNVRP